MKVDVSVNHNSLFDLFKPRALYNTCMHSVPHFHIYINLTTTAQILLQQANTYHQVIASSIDWVKLQKVPPWKQTLRVN